MRALLDVNVLVALIDRKHVAHSRAHVWLADNLATGWASCPLTENGCLRILTNPRYSAPVSASEVVAALSTAKLAGNHEFWPDDITITSNEMFDHARWQGHQQVTDVYLLALAVKHQGRLATFDGNVAANIVRNGSPEQLIVL
jgi:uncharacterized protein